MSVCATDQDHRRNTIRIRVAGAVNAVGWALDFIEIVAACENNDEALNDYADGELRRLNRALAAFEDEA